MGKQLVFDSVYEYATKRKMTISEVEKKANLSPNSIYKWKESEPKIGNLMRVAKVLGVSVNTLLKGIKECSEK